MALSGVALAAQPDHEDRQSVGNGGDGTERNAQVAKRLAIFLTIIRQKVSNG